MTRQRGVIVTGANDGLGRGIALAFARRGYSVGLVARRGELLEKVSRECVAAGAPRAPWRQADLSVREEQAAALAGLDDELGGATVFVANAGRGGHDDPALDNGEMAARMIALNVTGAITGIELMKTRMAGRGGGRIAGVASIAAARGLPGAGTYCATKAALHAYLQSLRIDFGSRGISVTSICPGFIDTEMVKHDRNPKPFLMAPEAAGESFARDILKGRFLSVAPWPFIPVFWMLRAIPEWLFAPIGRAIARSLNR